MGAIVDDLVFGGDFGIVLGDFLEYALELEAKVAVSSLAASGVRPILMLVLLCQ